MSARERLQQAHEKLQDAISAIVTGEDWKRMLAVAAKFHRYSANNHLLIFLQQPDATVVAGYRRWEELGRHVRKGEKGIWILAPCKYRTKIEGDDGEETTVQTIRGFRVVYVFDISQTEGEPLDDLDAFRPELLTGASPDGLWDALVGRAGEAGFTVLRTQRGRENGYCDFSAREIGVRPDVEPLQAVKTLIHEIGHALLHDPDTPDGLATTSSRKEVEVESVAYIVCDAIGLDSGDYSFAYVARWAEGSTDLVKETSERVITCAKEILKGLEAGSANENVMVMLS